jgi:hypothetical protein
MRKKSERIAARGGSVCMAQEALEEAVWGPPLTYVSVEQIEEKCLFELPMGEGGPGPPGDPFRDGFHSGLRGILVHALALPGDADFAAHFNLRKMEDLFWYFRAARGPLGDYVEAAYPEEIAQIRKSMSEENPDFMWGVMSGAVAAVRWLSEENMEMAESRFPDLDS